MPSSIKTNINVLILFLMLFLVNSLLGWLLFTVYILIIHNKGKAVLLWSIVSIIFVSLYNATKIPENDLSWYVDYYLAADKVSFKQYLTMLTGGKEQLYQVLVYGIHFLDANNYHVFIFIISIISYACLLRVLFILKKSLSLSINAFIASVSFLCFFPYTYAISVHIVRQVLASSLILWLLFEYYCGIRKKWLLFGAIATILIHSSAVFILPFFFLKQIGQAINRKNIWMYLFVTCMIFSVSYIGGKLLTLFASDSAAGYIAKKMSDGTTFDTTLPLSQLLFSVCLVVVGYLSLYVYKTKKKIESFPAVMFLHISTILLIFILSNAANPELQLRCNYFFWTYASVFVAIYLSRLKINNFISSLSLVSLFLCWNFYNLYISQWTYTCSEKYFLYSVFHYFYLY